MNEGGFDLVTASGDASTRLIARQAGAADQRRADPELQERRRAPAEGALALRGQQALRRALPVGLERADVQHQGLRRQAAHLAGAWCSRSRTLPDGKCNKGRVQAYDGPIYIADAALYLMKKKPELGIKDPYELNEAQYNAALDLLRAQRKLVGKYWHDAFVQIDDFTNEGVVASSSLAVPGQHPGLEEGADRHRGAGGRRHRLGRHHDDARRREAPELRLQVAGALAQPEAAGRPRGLVRLGAGRCSTPARATRCSATTAASAGPAIASRRSRSGRRRPPSAATQNDQCVPYHKWVSDYIAVLGGR